MMMNKVIFEGEVASNLRYRWSHAFYALKMLDEKVIYLKYVIEALTF